MNRIVGWSSCRHVFGFHLSSSGTTASSFSVHFIFIKFEFIQSWWTVTDSRGRARERYLFLFKARILVTKVRRVTDDRNLFLLKDIIRVRYECSYSSIKSFKNSSIHFRIAARRRGQSSPRRRRLLQFWFDPFGSAFRPLPAQFTLLRPINSRRLVDWNTQLRRSR